MKAYKHLGVEHKVLLLSLQLAFNDSNTPFACLSLDSFPFVASLFFFEPQMVASS